MSPIATLKVVYNGTRGMEKKARVAVIAYAGRAMSTRSSSVITMTMMRDVGGLVIFVTSFSKCVVCVLCPLATFCVVMGESKHTYKHKKFCGVSWHQPTEFFVSRVWVIDFK